MTFYAVAKGHKPGIYLTWNECSKQVNGFSGAIYKKFSKMLDAQSFVNEGQTIPPFTPLLDRQDETIPPLNPLLDRHDETIHPLNPLLDVQWDRETWRTINPILDGHGHGEILIFTDGACKMLPDKTRKAGFGYYIPSINKKVSKSLPPPCTNNRAELMAILTAVREYPHESLLHIVTDSRYSILIFTSSGLKYQKNNYLDSKGEKVLNADLVQQAVTVSQQYKLKFTYVKAHTKQTDSLSIGNNIADNLASLGAHNSPY